MRLLFLMLLCHIVDDFVLQPICLSNLKQREWWIEQCKKKNIDIEPYNQDYLMALIIHALSWAIMVHLPIILLTSVSNLVLTASIIFNAFVHLIIDDLKCNVNLLNLKQDQLLHIGQIIITYLIVM